MADTATTRNRLRKPESGQYVNAWAPELNEDFGSDRLDQALDGVVAFTLSGSKTLTSTNYETDEARMRIVNITSGTGGTVTIPAVEKWYWVRNATSGSVIFTCGGTTATVPTGTVTAVICNGTNVYTQDFATYASAAAASAASAAASAAAAATAQANAEIAETNAETAETNAEIAQAAAEAAQAAAEAAQAAAEAASLPSQTGNSGKYLTTNGSAPSWAELALGYTQIGTTQTPSGVASSSITGIPTTYSDLLIEILGLSHDSGSSQAFRFEVTNDGSTYTTPTAMTGALANTAAVYGSFFIPGYTKGAVLLSAKVGDAPSDLASLASGTIYGFRIGGGVNGVRFSFAAGNFDAGSWKLWGK